MMPVSSPVDHRVALNPSIEALQTYIRESAQTGTAVHEVEQELWKRVLQLGHESLNLFFNLQGNGDVGATLTLEDGTTLNRLETPRSLEYQSIFGRFELERVVYGSREKQKIEYVPLDNRLQLPESKFSYVLQDWDQSMVVEMPYGAVNQTLSKILGFTQSSDSLERMNRQMSQTVPEFQHRQPPPPRATSAQMVVVSADGKGVPMRRDADQPSILEHRQKKGPKPNRKKMAIVGTVYTIAPRIRTADEVIESLFRDPREDQGKSALSTSTIKPEHKRLSANLSLPMEDESRTGTTETFDWLAHQVQQRRPSSRIPLVVLMDGQESLWDASDQSLPEANRIEILDLLHATSRIWSVAHIVHGTQSDEAIGCVKTHLRTILMGNVMDVVSEWRQIVPPNPLTTNQKKTLKNACNYFENNQHRMNYGAYLKAGYPIASGVIEGACRHFVKDRMERAGMRWSLEGAQAMLELRSIHLNDDWDEFTQFRIQREIERLYPNRNLVPTLDWPLAV